MAIHPKVTDWINDEYNKMVLVGWVRRGLPNDDIADNMHISRTTFYKWKAENSDFADILRQNKEYCDSVAEDALFAKVKEGDLGAIRFWLTNRRSKDWRDKQDIEVSGDLSISDVIRKSRERMEKMENDT